MITNFANTLPRKTSTVHHWRFLGQNRIVMSSVHNETMRQMLPSCRQGKHCNRASAVHHERKWGRHSPRVFPSNQRAGLRYNPTWHRATTLSRLCSLKRGDEHLSSHSHPRLSTAQKQNNIKKVTQSLIPYFASPQTYSDSDSDSEETKECLVDISTRPWLVAS